MSRGAVLVTCNGRDPRGKDVEVRIKESGKVMEEDALTGAQGFVN